MFVKKMFALGNGTGPGFTRLASMYPRQAQQGIQRGDSSKSAFTQSQSAKGSTPPFMIPGVYKASPSNTQPRHAGENGANQNSNPLKSNSSHEYLMSHPDFPDNPADMIPFIGKRGKSVIIPKSPITKNTIKAEQYNEKTFLEKLVKGLALNHQINESTMHFDDYAEIHGEIQKQWDQATPPGLQELIEKIDRSNLEISLFELDEDCFNFLVQSANQDTQNFYLLPYIHPEQRTLFLSLLNQEAALYLLKDFHSHTAFETFFKQDTNPAYLAFMQRHFLEKEQVFNSNNERKKNIVCEGIHQTVTSLTDAQSKLVRFSLIQGINADQIEIVEKNARENEEHYDVVFNEDGTYNEHWSEIRLQIEMLIFVDYCLKYIDQAMNNESPTERLIIDGEDFTDKAMQAIREDIEKNIRKEITNIQWNPEEFAQKMYAAISASFY
jgi:hypothetical protein